MKTNLRTIQTRYGVFVIDGVQDKKMADALARDTYPNEQLLAVTRQFVTKESTVLDIGAHIGTFALPMMKEAKEVIAFEPSPEASALLIRNAKENNAPIRIITKALGSKQGSGTLLVRNASNAGANTLVSGGDIPVVTLDSIVAHADFIKIDVEGMELEVLRGAAKLIETARPVILFEVNLSQLRAHGTSPRALEHFFITRGYRLYVPLEDKNRSFARVYSMTLLTAFIAPRAWLLFGDSAPFDLVAVPSERELPRSPLGFTTALIAAFKRNIMGKVHRMRSWVR